MKRIKYIAVITLAVGFSACKDSFLDTLPSTQLVTENAIVDMAGANAALNGVYDVLQRVDLYGRDIITYGEVRGGDMQTVKQGDRTLNFYNFNNRIPDNSPSQFWEYPYKGLNRVNNILDALKQDKVKDGSEAEINDLTAQCYTLRALFHFDLVRLFGVPYLKPGGPQAPGAIIADHVILPSELLQRATVEETYAAVIADLNTALELDGFSKARHNGYINYWAAKALLARVYLYKGDFDNAFTAAEEVINSNVYELVSNADYVASWSEEFTSESIFDIVNTETDNGDREGIGYVASPNGYGAFTATDAFMELMDAAAFPNDVRLKLIKDDVTKVPGFIDKFPGRGGSSYAYNIRVIRLSEIYLLAAEAALRKTNSNHTVASEYLNRIRKRADNTVDDVTATLANIRDERRKELISEGYRFYDIMRTGETVDRTGGRNFLQDDEVPIVSWDRPDAYLCVLPIPRAEINVNKDITPTPGYSN